ncbi:MAG: acetate/propionate family kinase [Acidobacteria bacterium]|nr:acetate/propionate family kinase [Acidobacteriota bacterium]
MPLRRAMVLNAGSSTLKWSVLEVPGGPRLVADGTVEWHGFAPERQAEQVQAVLRDHAEARAVEAVGHRVVHGGAAFRGPVRITPAVRQALAALVEIDPLHTPAALAGIDAVTTAAPQLPQVAAFDTSFHATLPEAAACYPVPWEWTERYGLRRYGFHGLSVSYAAGRVAGLLGATPGRLLVCHLGSGCSLTAVAGGKSVDTSMGLTPLEGVMMATRSGSVDPGLLLYLERHGGLGRDELEDGLQHRSGLAGVSGAGADLRQVLAAAAGGSRRAALAYDLFVHSLVRTAGAMIAVLGGLDALVLTGGIGEHSAKLRADLLARLAFAGVRLDPAANQAASGDQEISPAGALVRVFTITAREDLAVLRELLGVLQAAP